MKLPKLSASMARTMFSAEPVGGMPAGGGHTGGMGRVFPLQGQSEEVECTCYGNQNQILGTKMCPPGARCTWDMNTSTCNCSTPTPTPTTPM
jgi:hypothetical protein